MPRVLIIAYYFPPLGGGGTQRTAKFVKYLPTFSWQPFVLTVKNAHHVVEDVSLLRELPDEAIVTRTNAVLPARLLRKLTRHQPGAANRQTSIPARFAGLAKKLFYTVAFVPDEYVGWIPFAVRSAASLIQDFEIDLILSSGPPNSVHCIARQASRKTGKPWIADLRDLWDQYPESYNPFRWRWRQWIDERLEQKTLAAADHLIVVSEPMRKHLLRKLPNLEPGRISVVTNGFDPSDFEGLKPRVDERTFIIVHCGTLFSWRRLTPFLRALRLVVDRHQGDTRIVLKQIGITPPDERLAAAAIGLANVVEFVDYLPYRDTLQQMLDADALLLLIGNIPHAENMMTSKLFDYLGAQRPIIVVGPDCPAKKLVEEKQLGIVAGENQPDAIAAALLAWIRAKEEGRAPVVLPRMPAFERRRLTEQLVRIMNTTAGNRRD